MKKIRDIMLEVCEEECDNYVCDCCLNPDLCEKCPLYKFWKKVC